jgi:hypothetical protein
VLILPRSTCQPRTAMQTSLPHRVHRPMAIQTQRMPHMQAESGGRGKALLLLMLLLRHQIQCRAHHSKQDLGETHVREVLHSQSAADRTTLMIFLITESKYTNEYIISLAEIILTIWDIRSHRHYLDLSQL